MSGTLGPLIAAARLRLEAAGAQNPALDVAILAGEAFGLDRAGLMLRGEDPASPEDATRFEDLIARHEAGEPVHRILGHRAFYEHDFMLSPETLEPRPDTEILVELAAEALRSRPGCLFADVGTGTGAIAISLLALFPQARALAIDLSPGALDTAQRNAARIGVAERFTALRSDYLRDVTDRLEVVVSNPPYIESSAIETLDRDVRDFDPLLALDGGADGLVAYRRIAAESFEQLVEGGDLLFEIGAGQGGDVTRICAEAGFSLVAERQDYGGHVRALWFRRNL